MSKYVLVDDSTKEFFTAALKNAELLSMVKVDVLVNNNQKELYKVMKANDLARFYSIEYNNQDVEIIVTINEEIFNDLEEEQKQIIVDEAVTTISVNLESGSISLTKPDVKTFSGVLRKYGYDKYERVMESVRSLYQQKEERERESR